MWSVRRVVALLFALPAFAGIAAHAAVAKPKPPTAPPIVGIADQKDAMFGDERFHALGIADARLSVAWDALRSKWQLAELDSWLKHAQATGVEPLITWAPSRLAGKRRDWPTPGQFVAEFRAFRAKYPWVKTFSTWNEANFCGFGPCKEPARVAKWWLALRSACPTCKILAADVLDLPSAPQWVKAFIKAAGRQPTAWGFHNYLTANRRQTDRTKAFLAATKGEVWFTETGGIVSRNNGSTVKLPEGVTNAARVTQFIFDTLAKLSPRVTRVYLYQWSSKANTSWDSGLITPGGKARPSLTILQKILKVPSLRPLPKPVVPPVMPPQAQGPPAQTPPAQQSPAETPPADQPPSGP